MTMPPALAAFDSLAASPGPISVDAAMGVASELAAALRASLMASTAAPKPRRAKAGGVLQFDMSAPSFARALKLAMRAYPGRASYPVLQGVRLLARGDMIELTCTDLDRTISVNVAAPGVGQWAAIVDAKTLANVVSKTKGDLALTLASGGGADTLRISGATTAALACKALEDWPQSLEIRNPVRLPIAADVLREGLAYVAPAMSDEATRYYLNGAFVHVADGRLVAVATDGHRLHKADLGACDAAFKGQIIPSQAVNDIAAILALTTENAAFAIADNGVQLVAGPVRLASRVIDGSFPDYARVIPRRADARHVVHMTTADLAGALDQTARVKELTGLREAPRGAHLARLTFGADRATLAARNDDGHSATVDIAAHGATPDIAGIALNGRYLRDALGDAESVRLCITSALDPIRIEYVGDNSRVAVIMPVRLA